MRETIFSPCRAYRYVLWREWDMCNPTYLQVIGLNPSTADETNDDPTIRRCIDFAKRWGYGALCMTNLFAYRATKPADLWKADDPFGPANDAHIVAIAQHAGLVLAAWGAYAHYVWRGKQVWQSLLPHQLFCLGRTKNGSPRHPLYVRKDVEPLRYVEG